LATKTVKSSWQSKRETRTSTTLRYTSTWVNGTSKRSTRLLSKWSMHRRLLNKSLHLRLTRQRQQQRKCNGNSNKLTAAKSTPSPNPSSSSCRPSTNPSPKACSSSRTPARRSVPWPRRCRKGRGRVCPRHRQWCRERGRWDNRGRRDSRWIRSTSRSVRQRCWGCRRCNSSG